MEVEQELPPTREVLFFFVCLRGRLGLRDEAAELFHALRRAELAPRNVLPVDAVLPIARRLVVLRCRGDVLKLGVERLHRPRRRAKVAREEFVQRGVHVEVLKDVCVRLAPLTDRDVDALFAFLWQLGLPQALADEAVHDKREHERVYGYYVLPLLEGDRFLGRADLKADRATRTLIVKRFTPEPGVRRKPDEPLAKAADRLARALGLEQAVIA